MSCLRPFLLALAVSVAGCASAPKQATLSDTAWARASSVPAAGAPQSATEGWRHHPLPGKQEVQFVPVRQDGRDALAATAVSAASVMRHKVRMEPDQLAGLRFSWKVPQLIADADLASRDADDSPVRVILAFEGDRSRFTPRDAILSELMRTLTGEEMPYATLMYVWCNKRPPGTVLSSPRTDRIRKVVLESGPGKLNQWLDYERDIRADYVNAFGEPPGALVGIALMTDSDNTRSTARAWYGPLRLAARTGSANR
jgi:hypothetical protein